MFARDDSPKAASMRSMFTIWRHRLQAKSQTSRKDDNISTKGNYMFSQTVAATRPDGTNSLNIDPMITTDMAYHPILNTALCEVVAPVKALARKERMGSTGVRISGADTEHLHWVKEELESNTAYLPRLRDEIGRLELVNVKDQRLWQKLSREPRSLNIIEDYRSRRNDALQGIAWQIGFSAHLTTNISIPAGRIAATEREWRTLRSSVDILRETYCKSYMEGRVCKWMLSQMRSGAFYLNKDEVTITNNIDSWENQARELIRSVIYDQWQSKDILSGGVLIFETEKDNNMDEFISTNPMHLVGTATLYVWVDVSMAVAYSGNVNSPKNPEHAAPTAVLLPFVIVEKVPYMIFWATIKRIDTRETPYKYSLAVNHRITTLDDQSFAAHLATNMRSNMSDWGLVQQAHATCIDKHELQECVDINEALWKSHMLGNERVRISGMTQRHKVYTESTAVKACNYLVATVPQMLFLGATLRCKTEYGVYWAIERAFGQSPDAPDPTVFVVPADVQGVVRQVHGLGHVGKQQGLTLADGAHITVGIWNDKHVQTLQRPCNMPEHITKMEYQLDGKKPTSTTKVRLNDRVYMWN